MSCFAPAGASPLKSAALEQRTDLRIAAAGEVPELPDRIFAAAAREQHLAETIAVLALQAAVLLDPLDGVRIEHFAPDVGVIAGRVAARERVREIRRPIARRHRCELNARFLERFSFKGERVGWNLIGPDLMPRLIEQRRREVFGRARSPG